MPLSPQIKTRYEDDASVRETFCDSVETFAFDGNTMRIELFATRLDAPSGKSIPTARKVTVCRLVITPELAVDLCNKLNQVLSAASAPPAPSPAGKGKAH